MSKIRAGGWRIEAARATLSPVLLLLPLLGCSIGEVAPVSGVASLTVTAVEPQVLTKIYLQTCMALEVEVDGTRLDHDSSWRLDSRPTSSAVSFDSLSFPEADTVCFFPDVAGEYGFTGTATLGQMSESATVAVTAEDYLAPTAEAGSDQRASPGTAVTLDGTASSDPEGGALAYAWWLSAVPTGATAALSSPNGPSVTLVPDVEGIWTVQLRVTDPDGYSGFDSVDVHVAAGVTAELVITDVTLLDAALPAIAASLDSVPTYTLDARDSFDPAGATLSFVFSASGAVGDAAISGGDTGLATIEVIDGVGEELDVTVTVDSGKATATASRPLLRPRLPPFAADATFTAPGALAARPGTDVDGDGYGDVLVALPAQEAGAGSVGYLPGPVTSGGLLTATLEPVLIGAQAGDGLGSAGAMDIADINGDGWVDLLVGAPGNSEDVSRGGAAYLVLGPATSTHDLSDGADWTVYGTATNQGVGTRVAVVTHDGVTELLVGDQYWETSLYSSDDSTAPRATFSGQRVQPAGDLDGDGWRELAMTDASTYAPALLYGPHSGTPDVTDGLLQVSELPAVLTDAGDVDGDGYDDLWRGVPSTSSAWLLQGPVTPGAEEIGATVSAVTLTVDGSYAASGDLDGDGVLDAVLGDRVLLGPITGDMGLWEAGTTLLESSATISAGAQPIVVGDLDRDGTSEVAWVEGAQLHLFLGHPE